MLTVSVNADFRLAAARLSAIAKNVRDRAVSNALNRAATTVRSSAVRQIGAALGGALKAGEIRKAIALRKASRSQLVAVLSASGRRRIPLSKFRPRQTKAGVSVRIGRNAVTIRGAFITPSGAVRVRSEAWAAQFFNKVERRTKRKQKGLDFPAAQIYAPGVPEAFVDPAIQSSSARLARERFAIEFERELRFALSRK